MSDGQRHWPRRGLRKGLRIVEDLFVARGAAHGAARGRGRGGPPIGCGGPLMIELLLACVVLCDYLRARVTFLRFAEFNEIMTACPVTKAGFC